MKGAERNVGLERLAQEAGDLALRVGRVGQAHGRLREAERPARRQRVAAGEFEEFRRDISQARPEE